MPQVAEVPCAAQLRVLEALPTRIPCLPGHVAGALLNSIDTGSQVCSLQWNRHERELLSSHGFRWAEHGWHL
jgi:hypothetical protein